MGVNGRETLRRFVGGVCVRMERGSLGVARVAHHAVADMLTVAVGQLLLRAPTTVNCQNPSTVVALVSIDDEPNIAHSVEVLPHK